MRTLQLTLLVGAMALAACDTDSIAPEEVAALSTQESGVAIETQARPGRIFGRLLERARELDDPEALELVEQLEAARDAARAAIEAGDREAARELLTDAREAMGALRTKLWENLSDSLRARPRPGGHVRQGRRAHFEQLAERIRATGNEEASQLLDQALEAKKQLEAAREAGDREAVRTQAQAFREAMREALELAFPEHVERMRGRHGPTRTR